METDLVKKQTHYAIKRRMLELESQGHQTSFAAIGRTLDPPVSREAVFQVAKGIRANQRIRDAIERELGQPYWIKKRVK